MLKRLFKLLKKVNASDIVVVVLILALGLSLLLFFKRKVEDINIRVKVTDRDILYANTSPRRWYGDRIEVGDVERDSLGRVISEIVGVEKFDVESDRKAVYVDIKIRGVYDKRKNIYSARGKSLLFGAPFRFYFSKVVFDGIITEFPGSDSQRNLKIGMAKVSTMGRQVEPAVAEALQKGDKIFDSNGTLLAEVIGVTVRPWQRVVETSAGDLVLREDLIYKDLILELLIRTKTLNGEVFIFDDLPLKIGEQLRLNFTKMSLFPIVTDFKLE